MEIFKTSDGLKTQAYMYWEFIKAMELTEEYTAFHNAIIEKVYVLE